MGTVQSIPALVVVVSALLLWGCGSKAPVGATTPASQATAPAQPTSPGGAPPPPGTAPPPPPGSPEALALARGPDLPRPMGMADLDPKSYIGVISRYGYGSLGNIGTGDASFFTVVLELQFDIAATDNIKVEGGVPAAMVKASYTDAMGLSTGDLGILLGNVWLGGRYIQPLELPNGSTLDAGLSAAVFLPTSVENSASTTSQSVAAGNGSIITEGFEGSHDIGRYARDQTTVHVAGDIRTRMRKVFAQLELGLDRTSTTVMGVDTSQLWFRSSLGGGVMLGASGRVSFVGELTTFSDFLDKVSSGEGFRGAVDVGFQFRKDKQANTIAVYVPFDSFARDHDFIGLQFSSQIGF